MLRPCRPARLIVRFMEAQNAAYAEQIVEREMLAVVLLGKVSVLEDLQCLDPTMAGELHRPLFGQDGVD